MGKHGPRTWGVAGMLALVVSGLAGCGATPIYTVQDDATVSEPVTAIRLDGGAGGVTIDGRPGTTAVALHRQISSTSQSVPEPTYRVEDGTLVLSDCGDGCSVEYGLTVPPGLPVTGRTSDGAIALNGVGAVDVGTGSGGVTMSDVAGPTRVETSDGGIRGSGINGSQLQVKAANGDIDLTPAVPQDVTVETDNGRITLTVPPATYQVDARTSNGTQRIDVPNDPDGRFQLDLTTSNGEITVRQG